MRFAHAIDELTCPAVTEAATSLTSLARAAPPSSSARCSKVCFVLSSRCSRACRSSSSGRRTGASPHTVSLIATLRRLASRRLGSAGAGASGSSRKSTAQSTMGSRLCGRSCSSHAGVAISAAVATPHRWRHGSLRWLLSLNSIRTCSLASSASARLLEGVAKGSATPPSVSSDRMSTVSMSLTPGACAARSRAASCASCMRLPISRPALSCDSPTTSRARITRKPRGTPVSATSSEPSHAARCARCLTLSSTRSA